MISINQQPQLFSPVYNELAYVVTSDNTSQPNFKYVFDIYINSVFITREVRSPNPDFGNGFIDVKRIVSPSVLRDFDLSTTLGVLKNESSFVRLNVQFGEQYGPSTGIVTYSALASSDICYAFAGALETLDFDNWDYKDYYVSFVDQGKFLTNKSRSGHHITEFQNDWLSMYSNSSGHISSFNIGTYDYNGTQLGDYEWLNPYSAMASTEDRIIKIPAGWNLNDIDNSNLISADLQPILDANVAFFDVVAFDSGGSIASERLRIYIDKSCDYGTAYDVHFQNSLGFEEVMRFTKWTSKKTEAEKKEYLKNKGTLSATSFTQSNTDETYVTYFTKIDNTWLLRSDWVHDNNVEWLKELIYSPEVRININDVLIPVTIINNNYEEITKQTGTIPRLDLTIKLPPDYRQLG